MPRLRVKYRRVTAIRTDPRRCIVAAIKGDALRAARARFPLARHPVDLRHSAAVAGEVNPLPIRRELGLGIDVTVIRQTPPTAPPRMADIDLLLAGEGKRQRQPSAMRRPGTRAI